MARILVVDDMMTIRRILRTLLTNMGHVVDEADNGQNALKMLEGGTCYDLVISDWNMPVMDGYEFLRELRKLPGGQAPKVVFCTTENEVAQIARAIHAGADEYIMKPFDKDIIAAKFQEVGLV